LQLFFDSIGVHCEDAVGGLTFEEFWELLVRVAMLYSDPKARPLHPPVSRDRITVLSLGAVAVHRGSCIMADWG
jgi:hypothetical protein